MGDERPSALPATYFLSLVGTHPTHNVLPLFFIYNCTSIFPLCTPHLFYAESLSVFFGGMYHSVFIKF